MRALFKTLFGDAANMAAVGCVVAVAAALTAAGHADWAVVTMPLAAAAAVAWLARR